MREHDFDAERNGYADRPPGFIIGGVTFRVAWGVPPELSYGWEDAIRNEDSSLVVLEANDRFIRGYLHPEDRAAWDDLRARETDPITSRDIWKLIRWLRETDAGRPTMPSPSSTPGRGDTQDSSADESPSKAGTPTG